MRSAASIKLSPLDFIELSGSSAEIAYALGKLRRKKIHRAIEYWNRHVFGLYQGRIQGLKEMERAFLRYSRLEASIFLEEIAAMGEGAGVHFSEIFRLNLTELGSYAEKCTDLVFPIRSSGGSGILLAHNEDWNPARNDVFLLKARLPELTYATLAYNGYLPGLSAGFNSFGLCHSVNYLHPKDRRIGLPRIFLTRYLLTAPHAQAFMKFIGKVHRAFGQAIHLAQGNRYWNLELSSKTWVCRKPVLPAVHTNHYLSRELKKMEAMPGPGSKIRLKTARRLLKERWGKKSLKPMARSILSDRSGFPYAIWRMADSEFETSATLAAVLIRSDHLIMDVYRDRPNRSPSIRVALG